MPKLTAPTRDEAETIAIRMAGLLAARPELMRRFLDLAGISIDDLRSRLAEPAMLAAVLDFVLFDDRLTCELADELGVAHDLPGQARRQLPGAPVSD